MFTILYDDGVESFIDSLELRIASRVHRTISLLETFGPALRMPYSKKIGLSLFELRIRGNIGARIFYAWRDGFALLLHGYIKKSDKIPYHHIKTAERRLSFFDNK